MKKQIFILLGMPGSGKGTQGERLSKEIRLPHISTGDIFRKMVSSDAEEAKSLNEYISQGKLVPSELVNKIVKKYILSDECKTGCILDGYPRNLSQAEYFIENIQAEILAVLFESTDEVVVKRIMGRESCAKCSKLYNKFFAKPKKNGICDECGGKEFVSRLDDNEETIKKRLEEYRAETLPLIEYYSKKNKLTTVNANLSSEEVFAELLEVAKKN